MDEKLEEIIFNIITFSGTAKSMCYEAINESEKGNFDKAKELLNEADNTLSLAHDIQTNIIQREAKGENMNVCVLFVHAQDHLMSSIEVRTLSENFIKLNERIKKLEEKC